MPRLGPPKVMRYTRALLDVSDGWYEAIDDDEEDDEEEDGAGAVGAGGGGGAGAGGAGGAGAALICMDGGTMRIVSGRPAP